MKLALSRKNLWEKVPRAIKVMLGNALSTAVPRRYLLGKRFRSNLLFARQAEWWSAEQSRAYQLDRLRHICRLAYERSSFYRRAFQAAGFHPRDLRDLENLAALPRIEKSTLRANLEEMCTQPTSDRKVDYVSTGGSSGVPLRFHIGRERSAIEYGYLLASWHRAGYRLGMPMAVLRGRLVRPERNGFYHEYDPILRHHHYSNFHTTDDDMRGYLQHIATIGPCFLHVYPSSAGALAQFAERSGTRAPTNIQGIIAESENVYPDQRRMVEKVFRSRFFSCYGHTEKLVLAAECERCTDYHVWPTYGFFELLDDEGNPVSIPGERGEIVGTGFINTVVPFIRYRTGDYATYVGDKCEACGREHAIIRDIRGHRTQEILVAADRSEICWTALNMHDDTFDRVRRFQFYQDTPGKAVLRIVPSHRFGDADRSRILRNLGEKLAGKIEIKVELTDRIGLSPRGKAIYVDQRIRRSAD